MEKISGEFPKMDMQQAMRLAQSDTAKQLLALLQSTNGGKLQSAMDQAALGDMDQAKQTLAAMLSSDQAQQLLKQLQREANG